ncbi:PHD finger protein ALFIN-LIKE 8 [Cocos nucifera]|uniref:PHD finger protein ALFIN-LIKE n=1 Tax=Cocos nucifera TaxID=13894 RepID=A0A8K0I0G0_COCNU|nr:PHD finger protein ALFIN-LIKE 8 [Cocos nucifera]
MDGGYNARTPEEVFRDFRGRRAAVIKALTTDVEKFYQQCDPEKENLCLYGFPNETWEVTLPAEEVPPELPEPALGINFARDGMDEKDWLSLVAVHSDSWLLAVAFYFGARFGFDKEARKRLFHLINGLPTIYEVVTGTAKKQSKEKTNSSSKSKKRLFHLINGLPTIYEVVTGTAKKQSKEKTNSSSKSKSGSKPSSRPSESHAKASKMPPPKEEEESEGEDEEDEEEHGNTLCGACGDNYANDEFWICCDICERWFHGSLADRIECFLLADLFYCFRTSDLFLGYLINSLLHAFWKENHQLSGVPVNASKVDAVG